MIPVLITVVLMVVGAIAYDLWKDWQKKKRTQQRPKKNKGIEVSFSGDKINEIINKAYQKKKRSNPDLTYEEFLIEAGKRLKRNREVVEARPNYQYAKKLYSIISEFENEVEDYLSLYERNFLHRARIVSYAETMGYYWVTHYSGCRKKNEFCNKFEGEKYWHIDDYLNIDTSLPEKIYSGYKGILIHCGVRCLPYEMEDEDEFNCFGMFNMLPPTSHKVEGNYRDPGPGEVFPTQIHIELGEYLADILRDKGIDTISKQVNAAIDELRLSMS